MAFGFPAKDGRPRCSKTGGSCINEGVGTLSEQDRGADFTRFAESEAGRLARLAYARRVLINRRLADLRRPKVAELFTPDPDARRAAGSDDGRYDDREAGRLAVAVPAGWSTNAEKCGIALSNTVLFEANGQRTCLITLRPRVSALHIVPSTSALARPWITQDLPRSQIDGVTIERSLAGTNERPQ